MSDIANEYYASLQRAFALGPPRQLSHVVEVLFVAYLRRAQVYTLGNGACAALAAHMACDLGRTVTSGSEQAGLTAASRLRVTSLAENSALVTATANDFLYEDVFVEQLRYLLDEQDVVIAATSTCAARGRSNAALVCRLLALAGPPVSAYLDDCSGRCQQPLPDVR